MTDPRMPVIGIGGKESFVPTIPTRRALRTHHREVNLEKQLDKSMRRTLRVALGLYFGVEPSDARNFDMATAMLCDAAIQWAENTSPARDMLAAVGEQITCLRCHRAVWRVHHRHRGSVVCEEDGSLHSAYCSGRRRCA